MTTLADFIKLGKDLGLEGEVLRDFAFHREREIKEEKQKERDEREKERDERAKEREKEPRGEGVLSTK